MTFQKYVPNNVAVNLVISDSKPNKQTEGIPLSWLDTGFSLWSPWFNTR
jgi:hypothetical protein